MAGHLLVGFLGQVHSLFRVGVVVGRVQILGRHICLGV